MLTGALCPLLLLLDVEVVLTLTVTVNINTLSVTAIELPNYRTKSYFIKMKRQVMCYAMLCYALP